MTEPTFDSVLAPFGLDSFFTEVWNRRWLHLKGGEPRFAALFSRDEFFQSLPRCGQVKAGFYDRKGWFCDVAITPEQSRRMWDANMTLCAGVLPGEGPRQGFIDSYRRAVGVAGQVYFNSYMSPDGQGFTLHIDDHPVFVLQVEGAKRWWLSPDIGVPNPVRGFSFPPDRQILKTPWGIYPRPDESGFTEILMEPGDALYVPAGVWHRTQAVEFSLSLTMATVGVTPLELVRTAFLTRINHYPHLYRRNDGIDGRALSRKTIPPDLEPVFEAAAAVIRDVAGRLDAKALYHAWLDERNHPKTPGGT